MDWSQLVNELRGAEYHRGVVTESSKPHRLAFDAGLTDDEIVRTERQYAFTFPPDLRAFLQTALPKGDGFPDWRGGNRAQLGTWLDSPKEGVLFDVEEDDFWFEGWGVKPTSRNDALRAAGRFLDKVPRLIPIYGHRMMPCQPIEAGNPVLSIHQTDIICYGFDLEDYLRHEFDLPGRKPWPETARTVPFWSDLP